MEIIMLKAMAFGIYGHIAVLGKQVPLAGGRIRMPNPQRCYGLT